MARLCLLLFLSSGSGRCLRRRIQHQLGPGSLALRKWIASGRARALPRLRLLSSLSRRWRGFRWLLRWCRFGATGGICRAGVLRQEVPHCLGRLLRSSKALCKTLNGRSKQPCGGANRVSRNGTLSASLISVRFSHRWCSSNWPLTSRWPVLSPL